MAMLGAVIYHASDLSEDPEVVSKALEAARPATGGEPFAGYRCIEMGSERHTRWRALTSANLRQLRADLAGRVLSAVHFDSARGAGSDASCSLDFWIGTPGRSRDFRYPHNIKVIVPLGTSESVRDFVSSCRAVWELVGSPYGLIYSGRTYDDVHMELTAIPSRALGATLSAREELRLRWLGFWQQYEDEIGVLVRGAYWGNFLGTDIVRRLGGLEAVLKAAPGEVVAPVGAGGVYVQVSNEPGPELPRRDQERLRALGRFLEPVSIAFRHPQAAPPAMA